MASSMHWLPFSRGVTCASGVLSCRAFLFVTRDGAGARRMFQGVGVDVSSARRLASLHAGFPVHVWRCRHPSPRGGWARCAERPPSRPWLPRVTGGRCYTRPCARAKGPSSFSAVRRLNYPSTRPFPQGERSSLDTDSRTCAARLRRLSGVRLASSIWLVCVPGPSHFDSSEVCLLSFFVLFFDLSLADLFFVRLFCLMILLPFISSSYSLICLLWLFCWSLLGGYPVSTAGV